MEHRAVAPKFETQEGCKGSADAQASSRADTYIKIQATNEASRSLLSPPCLSRLQPQALVQARVLQAVAGHLRTPHTEESKGTTKGSPQARA
jgi:hypothetical protein